MGLGKVTTRAILGSSKPDRKFQCKRCGKHRTEPYATWKKKPQKHKNVCLICLQNARVAAQVAEERAAYARRYPYTGWELL